MSQRRVQNASDVGDSRSFLTGSKDFSDFEAEDTLPFTPIIHPVMTQTITSFLYFRGFKWKYKRVYGFNSNIRTITKQRAFGNPVKPCKSTWRLLLIVNKYHVTTYFRPIVSSVDSIYSCEFGHSATSPRQLSVNNCRTNENAVFKIHVQQLMNA